MPKLAAVLVALSMLPSNMMASPVMAAMQEGLRLPIDCEPGKDCWIVRYVDHDPGEGAKDYTCGKMTGDCLLYTSPSPRDKRQSRMPSSA